MTHDELRPRETIRAHGVEVWMYDIDQAESFAALLKSPAGQGPCRPGTTRLWSDGKRRVRRARSNEASYRRRRC
jgi:hypothetical protein